MQDFQLRSYWNNRLLRHWGPEGVGSLAYGRGYNSWLYRVRARVFRRVVQTLPLDRCTSRILDVGCGTGFYLRQWQKLGFQQLAGLDISDVAIKRLRDTFPAVSLLRADVSHSTDSLPLCSFDVVGAFDVLFHIISDERYRIALSSISGLLKTGGVFVFTENFIHGSERSYSDYWRSRTLEHIAVMVKECGLQIQIRLPMFVIMNDPVDSDSSFARWYWKTAAAIIRTDERAGYLVGAALYPLETLLVRFLRESPTTELVVCKKIR